MSSIQQFYENQTIFLTGATGFLGKLILEKLLRTCKNVNKVYILVRPKYEKSQEERFKTMFENPCFDSLKSLQPDFYKKIKILNGDCSQFSLGLSEEDQKILIKEVTSIFHAAANVKFDLDLKTAAHTNVRSVREMLNLAKQMENLRAFVYVSTAFSHCHREKIDEEFYNVDISPEKLLTLVDVMDDKTMDIVTPYLLGSWPNTYVYTKAVAEDLIRKYKQVLPIAVIRPAIVTSTLNSPISGWIDNFHGLVGAVTGIALGVLRTLHMNEKLSARVVPADFVVDATLAIAWNIEKSKEEEKKINNTPTNNDNQLIRIYNFTGSNENLINWEHVINGFMRFSMIYPLSSAVWYYSFSTSPYKTIHKIRAFFLHTLFSYLIDAILLLVGKRPLAVEKYRKVNKLISVLSYFTTHTWDFSNKNVEALWEKLDDNDKKIFNFNMRKLDWNQYFEAAAVGGRIYLMKDPLETLPQARRKMYLLALLHYIFIALMLYLILSPIFKLFFN